MLLRFSHVLCTVHIPTVLLLSSFLLNEYTTICLSTHLFMDIWVVSSLGLFWIQMHWIFKCKYFCGHIFSLLLDEIPRSNLMGCMVKCMLKLDKKMSTCFPKLLYHHCTCSPAIFQFMSSKVVHILVNTWHTINLFNFNECVVVYYCFNLHFSDN